MGVYLPCIQNIFGVILFIRLQFLSIIFVYRHQSSILQRRFIVLNIMTAWKRRKKSSFFWENTNANKKFSLIYHHIARIFPCMTMTTILKKEFLRLIKHSKNLWKDPTFYTVDEKFILLILWIGLFLACMRKWPNICYTGLCILLCLSNTSKMYFYCTFWKHSKL